LRTGEFAGVDLITPRGLKSILRGSRFDMGSRQDSVRVLVELRSDLPGGNSLERSTTLGLDVQRVIGKTLVGSIERRRNSALRADPDVGQVELSVTLKPKLP
jgi:hypothetical protein